MASPEFSAAVQEYLRIHYDVQEKEQEYRKLRALHVKSQKELLNRQSVLRQEIVEYMSKNQLPAFKVSDHTFWLEIPARYKTLAEKVKDFMDSKIREREQAQEEWVNCIIQATKKREQTKKAQRIVDAVLVPNTEEVYKSARLRCEKNNNLLS